MDQPFLLADLWMINDVRSAKLDQLFHIVLDQLSRSAQLSRLNIPHFCCFLSVYTQYLWPISPISTISPMQCFYRPVPTSVVV